MKPADRKLALKLHRMVDKPGADRPAIARRFKLENAGAAQALASKGGMIERAEARRLTANEFAVMKALARVEARHIDGGRTAAPKTNEVDWAAGKRSGWCAGIVSKRLRELHPGEFDAHTIGRRIGFVIHTRNGHIWLTAAGWAFVWATGLILKNWKVPA